MLGTRSAAGMIAPALGGVLYGVGGFYPPIVAGVFIFATMLILKRKKILAEAHATYAIGTNSGFILKSKRVCVCQFINVAVMLSLFSCAIFFQAYLQFHYGVPSWRYGIMVSCFSPFFIGGATVAARMERAFGAEIPLFVGTVS